MVLDINILILGIEVQDGSANQEKSKQMKRWGSLRMLYLIAEW